MKKNFRIILLTIIILLSMIFSLTGTQTQFGSSYLYVVKPLLWIFIGILTFFFFKNDVIANFKYKKEVSFYVIVATLLYLIIYFGLGYIKGFAHNPYSVTLNGILLNLWTFVPTIIVTEYARFYMINNVGKKKILLWAFLISLLFTFININTYKFDSYFATGLTTFKFLLQDFFPSLVTNLFLTYVSYFAGYKVAILYSLLPQLALYVLPILPDVDWQIISILNSAIPFFTYVYINYMINKMDKTLKKKDNKVVGIKSLIFMILFVVFMALFGLGAFPIEPLVIASNSMYPEIKKGDIVMIQDKDVNDIKKGDIIRYKIEGYYVVHRVVMIRENKEGKLEFITKGDNNNDIDLYPVKESQVAGIIKMDIPYLGYPTIIVSKMLKNDVDSKVSIDLGRID